MLKKLEHKAWGKAENMKKLAEKSAQRAVGHQIPSFMTRMNYSSPSETEDASLGTPDTVEGWLM